MKKYFVVFSLLSISLTGFANTPQDSVESKTKISECNQAYLSGSPQHLSNLNEYDCVRSRYKESVGDLYEPLLSVLNESDLSEFSALYDEEKIAIFGYMRNDFEKINPALRSGTPEALAKVTDQVLLIKEGLRKAPKYLEPVYRGANLNETQISVYKTAFENKSIIIDPAIISASYGTWTYPGNAKFIIHGISSVKAEGLTFLKSEHEVIFPPDCKFRVKRFEAGKNDTLIELEETK